MKEEKKTVFTLLDNNLDYYCTDQAYEDYKEWCESNDFEPDEKNSNDYWQWVNETIGEDIDFFFLNTEYSPIKDRVFAVTGNIKLWNRTRPIYTQFIHGLGPLIELLWGKDNRYFKIELDTEKGIITSRISTHDDPCGNTRLEARMLNKNGEKWMEYAKDRGTEHEVEINNRWWTKITDIGMIF